MRICRYKKCDFRDKTSGECNAESEFKRMCERNTDPYEKEESLNYAEMLSVGIEPSLFGDSESCSPISQYKIDNCYEPSSKDYPLCNGKTGNQECKDCNIYNAGNKENMYERN